MNAPDLAEALALARRIVDRDGPKLVAHVAGGGTEFLPILLARGGGSSTLLSARIPYDPADFRALLGHDPGRLVDARAARGLAMAAFRHARAIRPDLSPESVFGLGSTSKLSRGPSERDGRSHEIHAAIQTPTRTLVRSITLPPGLDRITEERINALVLLNLIALGKGIDGQVPLGVDPALSVEDSADSSACHHPGLPLLLSGRAGWLSLEFRGDQTPGPTDDPEPPALILPGSFRPLHDGHVRMAEVASRTVGVPCAFELTLTHPEKPPLDYVAIAARLRGFRGRSARLVLTDAPTYVEKARLFPGATFVMGHDAAVRLLDPRYYAGPDARDAMLAELSSLEARFLVFGRLDDGQFRQVAAEGCDGQPPAVAAFLARNVVAIPEAEFRVDLSSTEVRARTVKDHP